jgi:uncharacterized protein
MTEITRHEPGRFCWFELATMDRQAATRFYGGLFGWAAYDLPAGPGMTYTILSLRGKDVGALYELTKEQRAIGVPSHWGSHVAVTSVDETVVKATRLGGTVILGPFAVMQQGRLAILRDPQGAYFRVWQPWAFIGARLVDEEHTACWSELATSDVAGARTFYSELFGWTPIVQNGGPLSYTAWQLGDRPVGGLLQMDHLGGGLSPHWMTHFGVADCDAAADRAVALGGTVRIPPSDIPEVGRFATIQDPVGAAFSIIRLTARP